MKNLIRIALFFGLGINIGFAQQTTYWVGSQDSSLGLERRSEQLIFRDGASLYLDELINDLLKRYPQFNSNSKEVVEYREEIQQLFRYAFEFSELAFDLNLVSRKPFLGFLKGGTGAVAAYVADDGRGHDISNSLDLNKAIIVGSEFINFSMIDLNYGLPAALCHELGHHESKIRIQKTKVKGIEFGVEGSADEYAARTCLPRILKPRIDYGSLTEDDQYMLSRCKKTYESNENVEMCLSIALAGKQLADYRSFGLKKNNRFEHSLLMMKDVISYNDSFNEPDCAAAVFVRAALCLEETNKSSEQCKPHTCWYGKDE